MVVKILKQQRVNNLSKILKIQVINYCVLNDLWINENQLNTFILMVTEGFDDFILDKVVEAGYYKGKQCVRNCRRDLEKLGLILQPKKRTYVINPELELNLGNVLYELKLLYVNQEEAH